MHLPNQSAPIQRTIPTASFSQGNGVEASSLSSILKTVASTALPIVSQVLPGLLSGL